jgi:hypothetical protein
LERSEKAIQIGEGKKLWSKLKEWHEGEKRPKCKNKFFILFIIIPCAF